MKKAITGVRRFVGLDVHAETIAAAIAEKDQVARDLGTIPNREESIRKLVEEAHRGRRVGGLLRGRTDGLRAVLAADEAGDPLRGDRPHVGADQGRGSGEDRSA